MVIIHLNNLQQLGRLHLYANFATMRYFLCIGICLYSFIATAQTSSLLTRQAETWRISEHYPDAITSAQQSADIALSIHDFTEATKALTVVANVYSNTKQFSILKKYADSALFIAQKAHKPIAMAYGYYAQALLYYAIDNTELVTKYAQLGLSQQPDHYVSAKINYLLYAVNTRWDNVRNVNTYAQRATENALLTGDYNLLSNCYTALSIASDYNYNISKRTEQRDSIVYYLKMVEALYQQHPKDVARKTYAIACVNMADYYMKYSDNQNAIHYANMARTVLKDTHAGQEIMASSLGILAEYAKKEHNYSSAESYLLEAYNMVKDLQAPYYYTLVNVASSLASMYEQTGNYPSALQFQKKVTEYNKMLFDQKQVLNAQKLEIQYETEKKNNELQLLKQREQYQRMQKYLYIGITIVSLVSLVFMFLSYYFRLRQLNLEMKLDKEEQSRLKAEQQLLEGQQQQLQKEAMVNMLQLEHKKDMLSQIKEKLNDNHINKIWNEELQLDGDFEDAKLQIQQVHPNFFNLLNEKTQQKLTALDLKLCAYLHLKMDTKKIAAILHIEPKSVRMSRYRIKQKLGLAKEEDLNVFLQNLG
jgi:DNA-binding CsgD family transcriptional regulator